jgi:ascorbate-specific PTS system EIIC-type component UlaA
MSIKLVSVFTIFGFLLLIISATTLVSNFSNIHDRKAMAQTVGTTNSTSGNAALLTYTNSTAGIKIQYPSNWQQVHPDNPSVTVRFVSP